MISLETRNINMGLNIDTKKYQYSHTNKNCLHKSYEYYIDKTAKMLIKISLFLTILKFTILVHQISI